MSDVNNEVTSPIRPSSEQTAPVGRSARDFLPAVRDLTRSFVTSTYLPWTLVGVGVLIRVVRYAADRSLWLDEAYLVLNLKSRSYGQLLETLDFNQAAPPGFLFVEKAVMGVLGDGEYALRLFPLLAGVASMVLAYPVARRYLSPRGVPIALFFFAALEPFTYYATEMKPYSTDILVTLVLLYLFARALDSGERESTRRIAVFAVTGAAGLWLSYPSVFVVAGAGCVLLVNAVRQRERTSLVWVTTCLGALLASFVAAYLLSIHRSRSVQESAASISSGSHTILKNLYLVFADPGALPRTVVGLAALLTFVGAVSISRRSLDRALMMTATVGLVLVAGLAANYPIGGRFIAFLLPLVALGLGEGIAALAGIRSTITAAVTVVVTVLLLLPTVVKAAEHTVRPPRTEEIISLLHFAAARWQRGDTLYVSAGAQYAFRYYMECEACSNGAGAVEARLWPFTPTAGRAQNAPALIPRTGRLLVGTSSRDPLKAYLGDVGRLRGRVWVLFTHYWPYDLRTLTDPLARRGKQVGARRDGVAALFLYKMPT